MSCAAISDWLAMRGAWVASAAAVVAVSLALEAWLLARRRKRLLQEDAA